MQLISLALGLLLASSPLTSAAKKSKADSAVLLSNVKSLTLYGDKKTSHRRVSAIPQLNCVGGNGCKHYNVDTMRCQNAGSEYDAEDIQWTCSASLPEEFKLGSTEVICEGFDGADDPWVLKGSCGVEYRLVLTDEGERKYGKGWSSTSKSKQPGYSTSGTESTEESTLLVKVLFWLAFIGVACFIIYRIFNPPNNNGPIRLGGNNRQGWGGGGGGGGGDNGWDDPPPPYSPRPPNQHRAKPSSSRASAAQGSSGPGFWSGAAAGAAGGYGAGYWHGSRTAEAERRERERARERERSSSWFGGGSRAGSGGGSSFFSGSGGGSSSPSSSRHESTGFGGTRRR